MQSATAAVTATAVSKLSSNKPTITQQKTNNNNNVIVVYNNFETTTTRVKNTIEHTFDEETSSTSFG